MVRIFFPNGFRPLQTTAKNQTLVNQGILACALERHRRQFGQNPESLDALIPRFLDKLPHDLITGKPLQYRRTGKGSYLLYSVGWNRTDEAGTIADDFRLKGDWVWPYVPAH